MEGLVQSGDYLTIIVIFYLTFSRSVSNSGVFLVFSAYQIATTSASGNGDCVTVQGLPISLPSQYPLTSPPAVDDGALQYNATTSPVDFLGFTSRTPLLVVTTALIQVTAATPTETGPSVNLTSSPSLSLSQSSTSRGTTASSPPVGFKRVLPPRRKLKLCVQFCLFNRSYSGPWHGVPFESEESPPPPPSSQTAQLLPKTYNLTSSRDPSWKLRRRENTSCMRTSRDPPCHRSEQRTN